MAPEAHVRVAAPVGAGSDRRTSRVAAAPAAPAARQSRPSSEPADDGGAPLETPLRGARASVPAPRASRTAASAGAASPAYGDWTRPSRADLADMAAADEAEYVSAPIRGLRPAPATTAIPERSVARRRGVADARDLDDDLDDRFRDDRYLVDRDLDAQDLPDGDPDDVEGDDAAPVAGAVRLPPEGPVTGGRAARRAELQAADHARKEAAKRNGTPIVSPLDEETAPRRSRVMMGMVAMVVVALSVLGVYQVTSPADEAASQATAPSTPTASVPDASALPTLPTLPTTPVVAEPAVAPDVKAPVTVLNATQTTGLAARIAAAVAAGGWETPAVAQYPGTDIAASTVYFTEGDETQRQAAVNLVDQFPQLAGPAPRFFEVPAGVAAPGLVIVTTGDWQP